MFGYSLIKSNEFLNALCISYNCLCLFTESSGRLEMWPRSEPYHWCCLFGFVESLHHFAPQIINLKSFYMSYCVPMNLLWLSHRLRSVKFYFHSCREFAGWSPRAVADFCVSLFSCCVFPLRRGCGRRARMRASMADPQAWVLDPFSALHNAEQYWFWNNYSCWSLCELSFHSPAPGELTSLKFPASFTNSN